MALRDAVPDVTEYPEQLLKNRGETWVGWANDVTITVASFVSLMIAITGVLTFLGVSIAGELSDMLLGYTLTLPMVGTFPVFVTLAFVGTVASVPVALHIQRWNEYSILRDDVNFIILLNTVGFLVGAVQGSFALTPAIRAGFLILGTVWLVLYVTRVIMR